VLALVLPACTCKPPINTVEIGFRVAGDTKSIDFGRVLENDKVTKSFTLTAETRAPVTVTMAVAKPFSVQETVDIEGGGQVEVPVTFTAGNGMASAEVVLQANGQELRVPVTGIGVRPPRCIPTAPCKVSTYSLEQDACIESSLADDSACEPTSVCLEQGRCRAGECLGVSRRCDDRDQCTNDACAMGLGCISTPRVCPAPANPCHVATCDPTDGCGETAAADLTPCGPVNCVTLSVCLSGDCKTLPTPDGVLCSPAVACLGEGQCLAQKCQRVDAGPWLPSWSAELVGTPLGEKPALLDSAQGLFFEVCDLPFDAGVTDAGLDDGGSGDSGVGSDAGVSDAGRAPRTHCALVSYTRTGFERFTAPFEDGAPRRLVHVSNAAVIMLADGGIEWRSPISGGVVSLLPTPIPVDSHRSIAALPDGTVVVAIPEDDGGSRLVAWSDAGVLELSQPGFSVKILAIDEANTLMGWDPVSGTLLLQADGGLVQLDGGARSLVTADSVTLAGLSQLLRPLSDGGVEVISIEWTSDAGQPLDLEERPVLLGYGAGVVFYRRCPEPMTSCLEADKPMYLRAFDAFTGAVLSERQMLPAGNATLEEAVLTGLISGGVATLVHGSLDDGGTQIAVVELLAPGQPEVLCRLGQPTVAIRGALFSGARLFVLDDRGPTGSVLQAYDLGALPLLGSGWARPDGVGGTRRAGQ